MTTTCFVSYEIHPTTKGGCGVLIHHAAEILLERGHRVVFLLDVPRDEFEQFRDHDRLEMPCAANCRAYLVDDCLADFPWRLEEIVDHSQLRSLRFAQALQFLAGREAFDYVEFFDYCGVAFYALSQRLYARSAGGPVLGVRLHSTLELLDQQGASGEIDRGRYHLWGLERGALHLAEVVLTPSQTFYEHTYRHAYGLPPEQVVVAQSPKRPFPRVSRRPRADGPFKIVFFGRLFHLKGVEPFIQAAALLLARRPALRCQIELIGYDSQGSPFGGSYAEYLQRTIPRGLADRFVFAGHLNHAEVVEHLNDALFAVFPNRIESFCYALHEVYDAGVPVIVNHLPAFADFFEHERNALVYDGTTRALECAMERLVDDGVLRERLSCPYAVATAPLGTFYESPRALAPVVRVAGGVEGGAPLLLVLCEDDWASARATLTALEGQTQRDFRVICLVAARPESAEYFWCLGRPWHARTPAGEPLGAADLVSGDALAFLRAGDVPAPGWLESGVTALRRRPELGFAGTWATQGGRGQAALLDVVPELYPFTQGGEPTRALIRTLPGQPLIDVLDANLGPLGEVGCLWDAVRRWGPGRLNPVPQMSLVARAAPAIEAELLQYLLASRGGIFAERLALYAGILAAEQSQSAGAGAGTLQAELQRLRWQISEMSTSNHKLRAAQDLGGRDLLKIVARKVLGRAGLGRSLHAE
jgi:glycosyltransferase involved in cell wall biosynthesis